MSYPPHPKQSISHFHTASRHWEGFFVKPIITKKENQISQLCFKLVFWVLLQLVLLTALSNRRLLIFCTHDKVKPGKSKWENKHNLCLHLGRSNNYSTHLEKQNSYYTSQPPFFTDYNFNKIDWPKVRHQILLFKGLHDKLSGLGKWYWKEDSEIDWPSESTIFHWVMQFIIQPVGQSSHIFSAHFMLRWITGSIVLKTYRLFAIWFGEPEGSAWWMFMDGHNLRPPNLDGITFAFTPHEDQTQYAGTVQ